MRYAILSDIHANRQALKAVLLDIRSNEIDEVISLGDIVGYGPSPAEVLEISYTSIHHFVLGNHDAVVCGKLSAEHFNDSAKQIIDWTCLSLDRKAADFFNKIPLVLEGNNLRCAHGNFADPGRFEYIFEPEDALSSFKSCNESILFTGHSHVPGIFVVGKSGKAHWLEPQDFVVEDKKRYIVNVGSIGQPRDNDIRASYCIFDTDNKDILFRKIPFDIDAYRKDLKKHKIPEAVSYFLSVNKQQERRPLRELIDFKPLSPEDAIRTTTKIQSLEAKLIKLKRLRTKLVILLLLISSLAGVFGFFYISSGSSDNPVWRSLAKGGGEEATQNKTIFKALENKNPVPPVSTGEIGTELISMPTKQGRISDSNLLEKWTVSLSYPESQSVSVENQEDKKYGTLPVFRLLSGKPEEMCLSYLPMPAQKETRFTASVQLKKQNIKTDGYIEFLLKQELSDGTEKLLGRREPKIIESDGRWLYTSITLGKNETLRQDGVIKFIIRGQFKGEILVRKCSLKRKN